jgi:hypothetical protein
MLPQLQDTAPSWGSLLWPRNPEPVAARSPVAPGGFDYVLDLVDEASEGLLEDICEPHLSGHD